ncbi:hypothetical protein NL676_033659 [Syzygium grande]|nr:hypothetical protein NL676_033659 [Syzygium grande]
MKEQHPPSSSSSVVKEIHERLFSPFNLPPSPPDAVSNIRSMCRTDEGGGPPGPQRRRGGGPRRTVLHVDRSATLGCRVRSEPRHVSLGCLGWDAVVGLPCGPTRKLTKAVGPSGDSEARPVN